MAFKFRCRRIFSLDDTALNPEYIPGPNDLANGVTLDCFS